MCIQISVAYYDEECLSWMVSIYTRSFVFLSYLFVFALIYGSVNISDTARWQEMPEIGLLLQN